MPGRWLTFDSFIRRPRRKEQEEEEERMEINVLCNVPRVIAGNNSARAKRGGHFD